MLEEKKLSIQGYLYFPTKPLWIQPIAIVQEKGRFISPMAITFEGLCKELKSNEVLCTFNKGFLYDDACVIESQEAFNEIYQQYRTGMFASIKYYAVLKEVLQQGNIQLT